MPYNRPITITIVTAVIFAIVVVLAPIFAIIAIVILTLAPRSPARVFSNVEDANFFLNACSGFTTGHSAPILTPRHCDGTLTPDLRQLRRGKVPGSKRPHGHCLSLARMACIISFSLFPLLLPACILKRPAWSRPPMWGGPCI